MGWSQPSSGWALSHSGETGIEGPLGATGPLGAREGGRGSTNPRAVEAAEGERERGRGGAAWCGRGATARVGPAEVGAADRVAFPAGTSLAFLGGRADAASLATCRMRFLRLGTTGPVLAVASAPTEREAGEAGLAAGLKVPSAPIGTVERPGWSSVAQAAPRGTPSSLATCVARSPRSASELEVGGTWPVTVPEFERTRFEGPLPLATANFAFVGDG